LSVQRLPLEGSTSDTHSQGVHIFSRSHFRFIGARKLIKNFKTEGAQILGVTIQTWSPERPGAGICAPLL
jgi:hypothetical protein